MVVDTHPAPCHGAPDGEIKLLRVVGEIRSLEPPTHLFGGRVLHDDISEGNLDSYGERDKYLETAEYWRYFCKGFSCSSAADGGLGWGIVFLDREARP